VSKAAATKRSKIGDSDSNAEDQSSSSAPKRRALKGQVRTPSTSPAPEAAPPEVFMEEGLDKDDIFRMVEDEFMDVARAFTGHLHHLEYQRLKKVARSQNAATIKSISRPVTMKMPDSTRRKAEGLARSKKQVKAIQTLLDKRDKEADSEDELEDENDDAWVGTALYGLMESPRRSTKSLSKISSVTTSTRAAAGYQKPHMTTSPFGTESSLPDPEISSEEKFPPDATEALQSSDEDEDEDDDLDAPARAPKSNAVSKTVPLIKTEKPLSFQSEAYTTKPAVSTSAPSMNTSSISTSFLPAVKTEDDSLPVVRRPEYSRRQRPKREPGDTKSNLDVIPKFLG